jgi:hypothetical protein
MMVGGWQLVVGVVVGVVGGVVVGRGWGLVETENEKYPVFCSHRR